MRKGIGEIGSESSTSAARRLLDTVYSRVSMRSNVSSRHRYGNGPAAVHVHDSKWVDRWPAARQMQIRASGAIVAYSVRGQQGVARHLQSRREPAV